MKKWAKGQSNIGFGCIIRVFYIFKFACHRFKYSLLGTKDKQRINFDPKFASRKFITSERARPKILPHNAE